MASSNRSKNIAFVSLPTVVAFCFCMLLISWHPSTRMIVKFSADEIHFAVSPGSHIELLPRLKVDSALFRNFEAIEFDAMRAAQTEPGSPQDAPQSAYVTLRPERPEFLPAVLISREADVTPGYIETITLNGASDVILKLSPGTRGLALGINLKGGVDSLVMTLPPKFQLQLDGVQMFGLRPSEPTTVTHFAMVRDEVRKQVLIRAKNTDMELDANVPGIGVVTGAYHIPISLLNICKTVKGTQTHSPSLRGSLEISFPSQSDQKPISIPADRCVFIHPDSGAQITSFSLDSDKSSIQIAFEGVAKIESWSGDEKTEAQPSEFEILSHNGILVGIFTLLVWIVPTCIAALHFRNEFLAEAS